MRYAILKEVPMAKITVTAKIGDTYHPKYGLLVKGQELTIDEEDFGGEIFERPEVKSAIPNPQSKIEAPAQAGTKPTKPRRY